MKKVIVPALALILLILVAAIVLKLISGAAMLAKGLIDLVIGLIVIAATIGIVIWMFSYAKKHKK